MRGDALSLAVTQGPSPEMRAQKKSSLPFLMPYWLHIFEVSKFATCWTRKDLDGKRGNISGPTPTPSASLPGPHTQRR